MVLNQSCLLDAESTNSNRPKIHIKTDSITAASHNTWTRILFYIKKNMSFSICTIVALFLTLYIYLTNFTTKETSYYNNHGSLRPPPQNKLRAYPSFEYMDPPDHTLLWNHVSNSSTKIKAAFVVVAQEEDLYKLHVTMLDIEHHFNEKAGYPWVIIGHKVFSRKFREWITNSSKSLVSFGVAPSIEWQEPYWIDIRKAEQSIKEMVKEDLSRGESMHWRRMSRYNAGFIAFHPLLKDLEYYWKVQPGSRYQCNLKQDPFQRMKKQGKKMSFALSLTENHLFVQEFDPTVKSFIRKHKKLLVPVKKSIYKSLLNVDSINNPAKYRQDDPALGEYAGAYSNCMIYNNFMIISLDFLRSKVYNLYFDELDATGNFFYQRWGDSFVQTFAAALLLEKNEISYNDVLGYEYDVGAVCPRTKKLYLELKCTCDAKDYRQREMEFCTPLFIKSIQGKL